VSYIEMCGTSSGSSPGRVLDCFWEWGGGGGGAKFWQKVYNFFSQKDIFLQNILSVLKNRYSLLMIEIGKLWFIFFDINVFRIKKAQMFVKLVLITVSLLLFIIILCHLRENDDKIIAENNIDFLQKIWQK
jgi:hypothetical protein